MSRRGLILVPEFSVDLQRNQLELRNVSSSAMEGLVRHNLPYWDVFDLPDSPIMALALSPSLEFLQSEGVVRKTNARPHFDGRIDLAELWVRAQLEALRVNEEREPGCWSLAQQGDFVWIPDDERIQTRVIETTLYRALPVPGDDVSFEDILEFKRRRAAELLELRAELDALYLSLVDSADLPRAMTTAISRVSDSLVALEKVSSESWASRLCSTMKVDVSLPSLAKGAIEGAIVASAFALPIELGAGLGAANVALKFELKQDGTSLKLPQGASKLIYAYKVERELR